MNLKSASELMHPGDHHRDANSHAERLPALVCGNFLSAPPVIALAGLASAVGLGLRTASYSSC
jgi:hypothetical protein